MINEFFIYIKKIIMVWKNFKMLTFDLIANNLCIVSFIIITRFSESTCKSFKFSKIILSSKYRYNT